jgi:hypothetical protein
VDKIELMHPVPIKMDSEVRVSLVWSIETLLMVVFLAGVVIQCMALYLRVVNA